MPMFIRYGAPFVLLTLPGILLVGCTSSKPVDAPAAAQAPWFTDVTDEVGLDFTHDPGPLDGTYFMPQSMGSGAALFDFDNDGRLDIYLVHNGGPKSGAKNKLYQQEPDGRFKDVSAGSGLDFAGYCMGVAVADVNNDGRPDVYVSEYGGGRLFLNQGGGKFLEVPSPLTPLPKGEGTMRGIENQIWGTAVSFLDYDRDGWLDLVVVNYLALDPSRPCNNPGTSGRDYCDPGNFKGTATRLYRNLGCDAKGNWLGFEDRTQAAGLDRATGPGLGVLCADLNGDGWSDIFVANDQKANHLWINQKNGTFTEEAVVRGVAYNTRGEAQANMGVAYGDIDASGLSSLFVTHINFQYHALWKQAPRGLFQDHAAAAGLTKPAWRGTGWGAVFADFDQDGALDLALVNGKVFRVGPPTKSHWDAYRERNQVFSNDGSGKFREISESNPALCGPPNVARGLAVGALSDNGAQDLLVTTAGGKARLLRNVAPNRGHWLMVRVLLSSPLGGEGPGVRGRDAIGAEIRVRTANRTWVGLVQPSQSYLCSNDPRVHFGLGAVDRVDTIEVLWPDGSEERFACPSVDRIIEVQRGKGQPVQSK